MNVKPLNKFTRQFNTGMKFTPFCLIHKNKKQIKNILGYHSFGLVSNIIPPHRYHRSYRYFKCLVSSKNTRSMCLPHS